MLLNQKSKPFIIIAILIIAALIGVFYVTANEMPKYKGFMLFFFFIISLDFYLWFSVRKFFQRNKGIVKYLLIFTYWLSIILCFIFFISQLSVDIKSWNAVYRTYLTGIMMVLFSTKLIAILFLCIADLLRFLKFAYTFIFKRNKFQQKFSNPRWKPLLFLGNTIAIFFLFLLINGMINGEFDFKIKKINLTFKQLPPVFDKLKIVQISDIHLGSWYGKAPLERAVKMINDLHPDIICFTGDLVNYTTSEAFKYEDILKELKAPLGIYSILGNHDYGEYVVWKNEKARDENMLELYALEKRIGWHLLLNSNISIKKDSSSIYIAGVENWGKSARFQKKGDINKAINGIDSNAFTILLSHDPSHWDIIISKNYQKIPLTLSGHTHGMQMGLVTNNIEWSPSSFIYKHWAGLYSNPDSKNPQYLYVNRGLGVIGYPGRVGIMPEITLFELGIRK
ncbi:MAG: metallophosphoesterase [Bacteroidetes bacterium]|nr:metallophosphoesterase [Bacteroidota bacterium]